jgi:hypothetical protein
LVSRTALLSHGSQKGQFRSSEKHFAAVSQLLRFKKDLLRRSEWLIRGVYRPLYHLNSNVSLKTPLIGPPLLSAAINSSEAALGGPGVPAPHFAKAGLSLSML